MHKKCQKDRVLELYLCWNPRRLSTAISPRQHNLWFLRINYFVVDACRALLLYVQHCVINKKISYLFRTTDRALYISDGKTWLLMLWVSLSKYQTLWQGTLFPTAHFEYAKLYITNNINNLKENNARGPFCVQLYNWNLFRRKIFLPAQW